MLPVYVRSGIQFLVLVLVGEKHTRLGIALGWCRAQHLHKTRTPRTLQSAYYSWHLEYSTMRDGSQLNSRAAREFMVAEVQKVAAVPCAVPSAECLAAGRLPKGTRHARAAESKRDFHIPQNSFAARKFMARPMIVRGFRQRLRSGDRSHLQSRQRRDDRRSLRRTACSTTRGTPINSRASREFMVAEVQKVAAVPCAVPSAECLAAGRLPKGTRHARAAESKRDFHIPQNSLAARKFMARPMIVRGFRQRSLRRTACST